MFDLKSIDLSAALAHFMARCPLFLPLLGVLLGIWLTDSLFSGLLYSWFGQCFLYEFLGGFLGNLEGLGVWALAVALGVLGALGLRMIRWLVLRGLSTGRVRLLAFLTSRSFLLHVWVFCFAWLSFALFHGVALGRQQLWLEQAPTEVVVTGRVLDTGSGASQGPCLFEVVNVEGGSLPAGVRLVLLTPRRFNVELAYGEFFSARGRLEAIAGARNPYGFDLAGWRHRQGADLSLVTVGGIERRGESFLARPISMLQRLRERVRGGLTVGIEEGSLEAQVIRAVVLGEKPASGGSSSFGGSNSRTLDDGALMDYFRLSGTLHVFAVSGLHVGMVALLLNFSLSWLHSPAFALPRAVRIYVVILGMVLYAGITGFNPPAVRATIMGSVIMAGFLLKRKPMVLNSLALSAIVVLLWDSHQLFTPGFQLSYGVLLAIALISSLWGKLLSPLARVDPFMPRVLLSRWQTMVLGVRSWLVASLSVSLSATIGSAPLIWLHFGIFTPIGIIAGIPLILIVFVILAMAMLSIVVGALCPPIAPWLNEGNAIAAVAAHRTARFFAEMPGGHWQRVPPRPEGGRVIIFDMPYGGGANLLDLGGGVLLDCGREDHFSRNVLPAIEALGVVPDSLIVTHADSQHSGGLAECLRVFDPQQSVIPRRDLSSPSYLEFVRRADALDHPLIIPTLGQKFPLEDGAYLEVLHAPYQLLGRGKADDSGLVIRLHWQGWRVIFTGDAGVETEARMLESGVDLSADVIVMGWNQHDFTGSEGFYRAVSPAVIVTSSSLFQNNSHVSEHWGRLTEKLGIEVIDQHDTGALTLTISDDKLCLTPTLDDATITKID